MGKLQISEHVSAPWFPTPGPSTGKALADEPIPKRLATPNNDTQFATKTVFITIPDRPDLESAFVQQVAKPVSRLHAKLVLRVALGFADLGGIDVCDPDLFTLEPEGVAINDAGAACNSAKLEVR